MVFFAIILVEKHNDCVVWCRLYRLNLVQLCDMLLVLKTFWASDSESQFLKLNISSVSFYYR